METVKRSSYIGFLKTLDLPPVFRYVGANKEADVLSTIQDEEAIYCFEEEKYLLDKVNAYTDVLYELSLSEVGSEEESNLLFEADYFGQVLARVVELFDGEEGFLGPDC